MKTTITQLAGGDTHALREDGAMARDVKRLSKQGTAPERRERKPAMGSHFTAVAVAEQTGASLRADGTSLARATATIPSGWGINQMDWETAEETQKDGASIFAGPDKQRRRGGGWTEEVCKIRTAGGRKILRTVGVGHRAGRRARSQEPASVQASLSACWVVLG